MHLQLSLAEGMGDRKKSWSPVLKILDQKEQVNLQGFRVLLVLEWETYLDENGNDTIQESTQFRLRYRI